MNRRGFLALFGVGAGLVAAPALAKPHPNPHKPKPTTTTAAATTTTTSTTLPPTTTTVAPTTTTGGGGPGGVYFDSYGVL